MPGLTVTVDGIAIRPGQVQKRNDGVQVKLDAKGDEQRQRRRVEASRVSEFDEDGPLDSGCQSSSRHGRPDQHVVSLY